MTRGGDWSRPSSSAAGNEEAVGRRKSLFVGQICFHDSTTKKTTTTTTTTKKTPSSLFSVVHNKRRPHNGSGPRETIGEFVAFTAGRTRASYKVRWTLRSNQRTPE